MDRIDLSTNDIGKLLPFATDIFHIESQMYRVRTKDGKQLIYKILDDYMHKIFMRNKEVKINFFGKNNIKGIINPIDKIYIDNFIAGYSMDYFKNSFSFDILCSVIDDDEKLKLIAKLIKIVKNIHKNNVTVGDLNYNNILTDGDKVKLCDCDSFGIKGSKCSTIPYVLGANNYIKEISVCTKESDVFILYLMILNIMFGYDINNIVDYNMHEYLVSIKDFEFPREINCILFNLYDMVNGDYELIYPDYYMASFKDYIRARKK